MGGATVSAHWTVDAMVAVVIRRQSAAFLREVSDAVPTAYLPQFLGQLEAVMGELVFRGEHRLATEVTNVMAHVRLVTR